MWARAATPGPVGVAVAVADATTDRSLTLTATPDNDLIVHAALEDLAPATRHRYRVTHDGVSIEGTFTTAPVPDEPRRVTFLWSGDLGGAGLCRQTDGGYAIFRAMAFASAHREETTQIIAHWLKVAPEIAARSYELGKSSWSAGGVVSDAAVRVVVEQSILELKTKAAVPLDQVRNWSFAEQAYRELASAVTAQ